MTRRLLVVPLALLLLLLFAPPAQAHEWYCGHGQHRHGSTRQVFMGERGDVHIVDVHRRIWRFWLPVGSMRIRCH